MKTMKKFLSMATLALVGATFTGCSSDDDSIIDTTQQPEVIKSNVVTMTTTVGLDGGVATRALTSTGVKTFAADDKIAVVYETSAGTTKVESAPITAGDISADGKSAKFTVTLTDAKASGTVKYIYPAAMAGATDVDYTKLNSQDGTLDNLAANLDLAVFSGNLTAEATLPASALLENKLSILAITLKNSDGSSDITGSITRMTLSDGTYNYIVSRSAAAGPIYVAIRPTSSAAIDITATNGNDPYTKSLTGKTYAANNGYSVSWKMSSEASEAVDLGLASGTKWSKMNVLATYEGHYGQFFAWGETTGYGSNTADGHNFDWPYYSLCGGSNTTLTKYNNNASYGKDGYTDTKTTLEAVDDAATVNWGSNWRMPTKTELDELVATKSNANYTWTWTTVDGHNGYKITYNTTSANIFLPMSGYRDGTSLGLQGTHGIYWSSSLNEGNPIQGRNLLSYSDRAYTDLNRRILGLSVRAVQKN